MVVTELSYAPMLGGPYDGALGINITFGVNGTSLTGPELIEMILRFYQGKTKILHLTGDLTTSEHELTALVNAAKDWNYRIHVSCDGTTYPVWFKLVDWLIVLLTSDPWLMFESNEVRLLFNSPSIPEPKLPPKDKLRYLIVPTMDLVDPALKFIRESDNPWAVLGKWKPTYLIGQEEGESNA